MIELVFYAACVATALILSWRAEDVRTVGWMLAAGFVEANTVSLTMAFEWRAVFDPFVEVIVGLSAAAAYHLVGSRVAFGIIALSVVNVSAAVAYNMLVAPQFHHAWLYVFVTNICFVAQCFLVGLWGWRHGHRVGGERGRPVRSRLAPEQNGREG